MELIQSSQVQTYIGLKESRQRVVYKFEFTICITKTNDYVRSGRYTRVTSRVVSEKRSNATWMLKFDISKYESSHSVI